MLQNVPDSTSSNWQIQNRIKCTCDSAFSHGPLTPVATAKAIGLNIWRQREEEIVLRVWDLKQDRLVENVDARFVVFITHRWVVGEVKYADIAKNEFSISKSSLKLCNIRDTLLGHTRYVWIDTICIDKGQLNRA